MTNSNKNSRRYRVIIYLIVALIGIVTYGSMIPNANGQPNRPTVFTFLNLPTSARLNALGGVAPAVSLGEIHLSAWHPALIADAPTELLGLSVVNYVAVIRAGQAVTLRESPKTKGKFLYTAGFINYGSLERTDPAGNSMGQFSANEVVLQSGWGTRFAKQFTAGVSAKFIGSFLDSYSSSGIALDMGASWQDTSGRSQCAVLFRNFGTTLWSYSPGSINGRLPLDIQFSYSNRLEHMPLRWGVVLHQLHNWRLRYTDPSDTWYNPQFLFTEESETPQKGTPWIDEAFRHIVLQSELLLSKNLQFQLSYNHQRRKELTLPTRSGSSGFAWGFALHTKRFRLDYSRAAHTLSGTTHQFSVTSRIRPNT
ncbi:MAG: type IX secretion system protein PorQ [Bacteroidetes bacterium]|nr:type IX secretion system protein PorQ [Bacteroidota bacterium]